MLFSMDHHPNNNIYHPILSPCHGSKSCSLSVVVMERSWATAKRHRVERDYAEAESEMSER